MHPVYSTRLENEMATPYSSNFHHEHKYDLNSGKLNRVTFTDSAMHQILCAQLVDKTRRNEDVKKNSCTLSIMLLMFKSHSLVEKKISFPSFHVLKLK